MTETNKMTVGEVINYLSSYEDHEKVTLWVKTSFYKGQLHKWRSCGIGKLDLGPEGPVICQEWKDDYDG